MASDLWKQETPVYLTRPAGLKYYGHVMVISKLELWRIRSNNNGLAFHRRALLKGEIIVPIQVEVKHTWPINPKSVILSQNLQGWFYLESPEDHLSHLSPSLLIICDFNPSFSSLLGPQLTVVGKHFFLLINEEGFKRIQDISSETSRRIFKSPPPSPRIPTTVRF